MPRKFINRRSDSEKAKAQAADEWDHITNLGEDNKKLDIQDALEVKDRSFFLNDEAQKQQTHWEKTKEATRNAMDRAGNTSQYIKYVNHHFEKQKSTINKVKEIKANYDRELKLLQHGNDVNNPLKTDTKITKTDDITNEILSMASKMDSSKLNDIIKSLESSLKEDSEKKITE